MAGLEEHGIPAGVAPAGRLHAFRDLAAGRPLAVRPSGQVDANIRVSLGGAAEPGGEQPAGFGLDQGGGVAGRVGTVPVDEFGLDHRRMSGASLDADDGEQEDGKAGRGIFQGWAATGFAAWIRID